jgi:hypothetical protein
LFFDPARVMDWAGANDIEIKIADDRPTGVPPASVSVASPSTGSDPDLPKSGIVGAIARLRAMERLAYTAFLQSMRDKEPHTRTRAKEKIYLAAHEALRRTEKDVPGILEHRGEMIPLETVLAEQTKIDVAIKTALLTLPRKLSPELATMSDAGEIEGFLIDEVDDILRSIASGDVLQDETTRDI